MIRAGLAGGLKLSPPSNPFSIATSESIIRFESSPGRDRKDKIDQSQKYLTRVTESHSS